MKGACCIAFAGDAQHGQGTTVPATPSVALLRVLEALSWATGALWATGVAAVLSYVFNRMALCVIYLPARSIFRMPVCVMALCPNCKKVHLPLMTACKSYWNRYSAVVLVVGCLNKANRNIASLWMTYAESDLPMLAVCGLTLGSKTQPREAQSSTKKNAVQMFHGRPMQLEF